MVIQQTSNSTPISSFDSAASQLLNNSMQQPIGNGGINPNTGIVYANQPPPQQVNQQQTPVFNQPQQKVEMTNADITREAQKFICDTYGDMYQTVKEEFKMANNEQQQNQNEKSFLDTNWGKAALVGGGIGIGVGATKLLSNGGKIGSEEFKAAAKSVKAIKNAGIGNFFKALFK